MKAILQSLAVLGLMTAAQSALAYPVIDTPVAVGGLPIAVYRDSQATSVYWYIPQSIEPWKRDGTYKSALYESADDLTFVFRGQASVEDSMLDSVAQSLGTSRANLMPITYDTSSNLVCENVYTEEDKVSWKFPTMIGNYLEVVPVTIRTTKPSTIKAISHLIHGGGLACTVEVMFKGVSTAYNLLVEGDWDQVYDRFEADAHAEGFFWEADMHTVLEDMRAKSLLVIHTLDDTTYTLTEQDKQARAASDEILKQMEAALFTPALKIPTGDQISGRGKPWSLRADYRHMHQQNSLKFVVNSQKVFSKSSQISLRLAVEDAK